MSVLRRMVYRDIGGATSWVALAFLGLFFFFDFVDELPAIGRKSLLDPQHTYEIKHALLRVLLQVPNHAYEIIPIAVLIGAVFVFSRLAQGSEYTILRTSGLGPWRALRMMLGLGLVFVGITFVVGDYVAPVASRTAQLLKAQYEGRITVGAAGAWLKEKQPYSQYSVNVNALNGKGELEGIRIFEFDNQGRLVSRTQAQRGQIDEEGGWQLQQVLRTEFAPPDAADTPVQQRAMPTLFWPNSLTG